MTEIYYKGDLKNSKNQFEDSRRNSHHLPWYLARRMFSKEEKLEAGYISRLIFKKETFWVPQAQLLGPF